MGAFPAPQYAGCVDDTREQLKAQVEQAARQAGHAPGPWLEVGHAAQLGCLACDRYGFVQFVPPPGRVMADALEAPCPDRGGRLIQVPDDDSLPGQADQGHHEGRAGN